MPRPKLAKNRPLDIIIGKGLLTTEALLAELREKLAARAIKYRGAGMSPFLFASLEELLDSYEPLIAENLFSTDVAAWIQSLREVASKLPSWAFKKFSGRPGLGGFNLPPIDPPAGNPLALFGDAPREPLIRFPAIENAIDSLLSRKIADRSTFDAMTAQERDNAFTIARETRTDAIERVRDVLARNLREGPSLADFEESIKGELESSFIGPGHVENVFRTNAQNAFSDGHWEIANDPIVSEIFPYRDVESIHDRRCRDEHRALEKLGLSGTNIYRCDDIEFWNNFLAPWSWQCRCANNLLTIEDAADRGVYEAKQWLRTGRKPPMVSRMPHIEFRPPPGFVRGRRVAA